MKILVDHQIFLRQKVGGISRYHAAISEQINMIQAKHQSDIFSLGDSNLYLRKGRCEYFRFLNKGRPTSILKKVNEMIVKMKSANYDVLHPTYYDNYPIESKLRTPFVITIHDFIPEKYFGPSYVDFVQRKRLLAEKAAAVIAISESTKRDIFNFYNIDPAKVHIVRHGHERPNKEPRRIGGREPYILYVGGRWGYKNFKFFVESVSPVLLKHQMRLKIVGSPLEEHESALISGNRLTSLTEVLTDISDEDLHDVFQRATCFVFPSWEEGFGIPILEAFAHGCPLLCSDTPVFREVAGEAALYFDPFRRDELAGQLDKVIADMPLTAELVEKGFKRLDYFSWKKSAEETIKVYESVLR